MALYLDTSCLLKLLFLEPESDRVAVIVAGDTRVVISSLTWIEALVRIQGRCANRDITPIEMRRLVRAAERFAARPPFERQDCPAAFFLEAERQILQSGTAVYCRTLDRLHLAAAISLGLDRLLTNDDVQARAARAVGLQILMPR